MRPVLLCCQSQTRTLQERKLQQILANKIQQHTKRTTHHDKAGFIPRMQRQDNIYISLIKWKKKHLKWCRKKKHLTNVQGCLAMMKLLVAQSCLTLCDPMNGSLPGSSVLGILQTRILEWVDISFSRGSSQPRDQTLVSCITGTFFTIWPPGRNVSQCNRDHIWHIQSKHRISEKLNTFA